MTDGIHAPRREPAPPPTPSVLADIGGELLEQAHALDAGRSARTLTPGAGAALKQTLLALVAETRLAEHQTPGPASLYVVSGDVRIGTSDGDVALTAGQWTLIPDQPHDLAATTDAVVLLTVAAGP